MKFIIAFLMVWVCCFTLSAIAMTPELPTGTVNLNRIARLQLPKNYKVNPHSPNADSNSEFGPGDDISALSGGDSSQGIVTANLSVWTNQNVPGLKSLRQKAKEEQYSSIVDFQDVGFTVRRSQIKFLKFANQSAYEYTLNAGGADSAEVNKEILVSRGTHWITIQLMGYGGTSSSRSYSSVDRHLNAGIDSLLHHIEHSWKWDTRKYPLTYHSGGSHASDISDLKQSKITLDLLRKQIEIYDRLIKTK